jgi:hypothetical protein
MNRAIVAMTVLLVAIGCARQGAVPASADSVLIEKQARRLTLLSEGQVIRSYGIALGGDPIGHKLREGDERTPEGLLDKRLRRGHERRDGRDMGLRCSWNSRRDQAVSSRHLAGVHRSADDRRSLHPEA